jgi:hypothetical protein
MAKDEIDHVAGSLLTSKSFDYINKSCLTYLNNNIGLFERPVAGTARYYTAFSIRGGSPPVYVIYHHLQKKKIFNFFFYATHKTFESPVPSCEILLEWGARRSAILWMSSAKHQKKLSLLLLANNLLLKKLLRKLIIPLPLAIPENSTRFLMARDYSIYNKYGSVLIQSETSSLILHVYSKWSLFHDLW